LKGQRFPVKREGEALRLKESGREGVLKRLSLSQAEYPTKEMRAKRRARFLQLLQRKKKWNIGARLHRNSAAHGLGGRVRGKNAGLGVGRRHILTKRRRGVDALGES